MLLKDFIGHKLLLVVSDAFPTTTGAREGNTTLIFENGRAVTLLKDGGCQLETANQVTAYLKSELASIRTMASKTSVLTSILDVLGK